MSTSYINTTEDTEMSECEGEKVVTMMDVLQEQEEFEEDANAVLGASDDKNCTYSKGYIKRQAVYACLTCCSDAKDDPTKRAGICLACSLNCHENHELIELYTRRNFRCDCGNPKLNSHPCQFTPNKTDLNEDNRYNQNFIGIYCTCHRPYPDPDAVVEDEMIQCTICEDWLHASHLEATLPSNDQYSEMICKACMEVNEFLHDYSYWAVNVDVDVEITFNETVEPVNKKEILPNGSCELSSTSHETSEGDSANGTMEINDKNEVMKCTISSITSNSIEQDSLDFTNGTIIETKSANETAKEEVLEIKKFSSSREVDINMGSAVDEAEGNNLDTNRIVTPNDGINASDKDNMSLETEESKESQQMHTNNIQDYHNQHSIIENDPISKHNKSNLETSIKECSVTNKIKELPSSNENEIVLKDKELTEDTTTKHGTGSHCNSECPDQDYNITEETELSAVPKTNQKDPIQSSDICSVTDTAVKDLDSNEPNVEVEDQSTKIDENFDKEYPIQSAEVNSEVGNILKDLETNPVETGIENHSTGETEENTKEIPLQSTEINSVVDTVLKHIEHSSFVDKSQENSTEVTATESTETDTSESTSVNNNIAITSNDPHSSETEVKCAEQSTEKIHKVTDKNNISDCTKAASNLDSMLNNIEDCEMEKTTEVDIEIDATLNMLEDSKTKTESNLDTMLNNLEDCEMENKCEEQFPETTNKDTVNNDISKTTEVGIKVDSTLNMSEGNKKETKAELQTTETIKEVNDKEDFSKPTEVNTTDDTLDNVEDSDLGNNIVDQSTELVDKGIDNEDILQTIRVDNNIDTLNNLEGNNTETLTEKEGTEKADIRAEEGVDQSDTLEKATRELLELTSDMVEECEEELLKSNDEADTHKELNGSDELSETCIPTERDKENIDIDMNNIKTGESINDISQVEESSYDNAQTKNENKRKCEENEDVEVKKAKFEDNKCIRPKGVQRVFKGATFWPSDFRQKLCTCNECLTMYKDLRLLFLLDPEDTVTAYETLGKEKIDGTPSTQYEKGLQALSSLDRVQQINALTEYNIMRDKLLDFLKSFKERKEIVKEEDIRAFFAGMKPRREPDGVYFCR